VGPCSVGPRAHCNCEWTIRVSCNNT
jgi:hypothetical protein